MLINGYKVNVVCANYDKEVGGYGDIYNCVEDCLREHPEDEVIYGYHLYHSQNETPDWFDTIEEAINWASND